MKTAEHIATIKTNVKALLTEGHVERKPGAYYHRDRVEAAVNDLEQALIQESKQKGETDGTVG